MPIKNIEKQMNGLKLVRVFSLHWSKGNWNLNIIGILSKFKNIIK